MRVSVRARARVYVCVCKREGARVGRERKRERGRERGARERGGRERERRHARSSVLYQVIKYLTPLRLLLPVQKKNLRVLFRLIQLPLRGDFKLVGNAEHSLCQLPTGVSPPAASFPSFSEPEGASCRARVRRVPVDGKLFLQTRKTQISSGHYERYLIPSAPLKFRNKKSRAIPHCWSKTYSHTTLLV